ncbi:MAG: CAP domain-containing protein [Haliscomenobacter sp.]|nr:CAP domain-containing protein [Haliscomenobacter sp.]MBK7475615.1 CAP domain-containing protein [Haliscomenobacter sp.]MBK8878919.1 CAP domain-containing protein [Haliscomenobacter sp.]
MKNIRFGIIAPLFLLPLAFLSVSTPSLKPDPSAFETQMLAEVNQIRQSGCQCGDRYFPPVPAVTWDARLAKAARMHAADMKARNRMSHTGSDGSTIGQRARRAGYPWSMVGENIAWGYTDIPSVVDGWKTSDGHCRNMMTKEYVHLGAARYGTYWVQDFGVPR